MQLLITGPAANSSDYPLALDADIVTDVSVAAANDCPRTSGRRHPVDVNVMVGRVVGHVMSKLADGPNTDVKLVLTSGRHLVQTDPVALAFALSGVLTAQLASIEDPEDGQVCVTTAADRSGVRVMISTDGVPPLGFVRAVACDDTSAGGDPTLIHCRRLIEDLGGTLQLVEQNGRIALCVAFPPVIPTNVVPMHKRCPRPTVAADPLRLVA